MGAHAVRRTYYSRTLRAFKRRVHAVEGPKVLIARAKQSQQQRREKRW